MILVIRCYDWKLFSDILIYGYRINGRYEKSLQTPVVIVTKHLILSKKWKTKFIFPNINDKGFSIH
jgi:hypothetical protein